MGRNKNKDNRTASRRKQSAVQAGSRPSGGLKKDLGVPSFFKQRKQAEREQQPNVGRQNGKAKQTEAQVLSDYANDACAKGDGVNLVQESDNDHFERAARDLALSSKRDSSVKAFMRDMKNVIDNSDVLLQVLDARDPQGSRSRQTERLAMSCGKKVVLILNKVDLIPSSNLQGWLRYLRNDFPTLAFKASTQQQRSHLKQGRGQFDLPQASTSANKMSFGSEAIGANALLQLLKNYARTAVKGSNVKQQLTVGVVGPPNVGKSSLINSLLRTRACAVASTPGWTKVVQGVMLEKGIRLLDCPGVALNTGSADGEGGEVLSSDDAAWNMLRNTVKVELIEDPIAPIQAMLKRVDAPQLEKLYNIEGGFNEGDAHDFLLRVALLRGKLARGGIADLEGAAKIVLHDWNIGRISFFTEPPAVHASLAKTIQATVSDGQAGKLAIDTERSNQASALIAGSSLVSGFAEAFDLAALLGEADAEALGLSGAGHGGGEQGGLKGKDLVQARERVFAPSVTDDAAQAIEVEEEQFMQPQSKGDTTHSSLGKRRRNVDDDDDDDDDDEDNAADSSEDDDGQSDDEIGARMTDEEDSLDDLFPDGHSNNAHVAGKMNRQALTHRQRELQTTFGEEELASMAQRRGDKRKAAKKAQKRLRKSGAGLVDAWTNAMDLRDGQTVSKADDVRQDERQGATRQNVFLNARNVEFSRPVTAAAEEEEL